MNLKQVDAWFLFGSKRLKLIRILVTSSSSSSLPSSLSSLSETPLEPSTQQPSPNSSYFNYLC